MKKLQQIGLWQADQNREAVLREDAGFEFPKLRRLKSIIAKIVFAKRVDFVLPCMPTACWHGFKRPNYFVTLDGQRPGFFRGICVLIAIQIFFKK